MRDSLRGLHTSINKMKLIGVNLEYDEKNSKEDYRIVRLRSIEDNVRVLRIPEGIDEIRVNKQSPDPFNRKVEKVVLPNGLRVVGEGVFSGFQNLEVVNFPDSLERIERSAFEHCGITGDIMLNNIEFIGECAFSYSNVRKVDFSENLKLKEIGNSAFSSSRKLEELYLSPQLQGIGSYAFCWCTKLRVIGLKGVKGNVFPSTMNRIGRAAMCCCDRRLAELDLSNTKITEILADTFSECFKLEKVKLPESITEIDKDAFNFCDKLKLEDRWIKLLHRIQ